MIHENIIFQAMNKLFMWVYGSGCAFTSCFYLQAVKNNNGLGGWGYHYTGRDYTRAVICGTMWPVAIFPMILNYDDIRGTDMRGCRN